MNVIEIQEEAQILNEKTWLVDRKIYADLPFKPGVPLDSGIYDSIALGTHSIVTSKDDGLEFNLFNKLGNETLVFSLSHEEIKNLKKFI